jgi:hypothetical protein
MPDEIKEPKHRHVASSDVVRLTVHEESDEPAARPVVPKASGG